MAHHPPPRWSAEDGLLVARFRHGPLWNFSYLVACERTGEAAVIDPAWDAQSILNAALGRQLTITTVLLTHSHADHINAAADLLQATGARAFVHTGDAAELPPRKISATTFGGSETIAIGDLIVEALHTPGHTPGSVSYSAPGHLFTGDTLAVGSPGTPGPEAGALEALWASMGVFERLSSATVIHPGHDSGPAPTSSFETERGRNPALLARSLEEFRPAVERATGRSHR